MLKGKQASFSYGRNRVYDFRQEDIESCMRRHPYLVDPNTMPESFFRAIVREQWERNPWYTCGEAGKLLGLKDRHASALKRYIAHGWIKVTTRPGAGGWGEFIIRKSAIDTFLEHDPRPILYHANRSAAAAARIRK